MQEKTEKSKLSVKRKRKKICAKSKKTEKSQEKKQIHTSLGGGGKKGYESTGGKKENFLWEAKKQPEKGCRCG